MFHPLPTGLALIGPIGTPELIILAIIGLLIFGKRLPEVGKSVGKGIVEFKRGLQGIEDQLDEQSQRPQRPPDQIEAENPYRAQAQEGAASQPQAQPQSQTQPHDQPPAGAQPRRDDPSTPRSTSS